MFVQEMSEPHNYSRMSKVKKMTLAVQGTIVGALLMSIVWLVPYAASSPITIIPAAFATITNDCLGEPATIVGTEGNDP
jgi:hypothetical protein